MKKIGIDAGATLTKIAYEEKGRLHVKSYNKEKVNELLNWLQMLAPEASLYGTGGKWQEIAEKTKQKKQTVDEFAALVKGSQYLLSSAESQPKEFILVSIGTGTSIFYVNGNRHERVLGTGIGGGTWMGLGSLLTGTTRFQGLVELAASGNHKKSDLLVSDIYGSQDVPLVGDLTASNFGKPHHSDVQSENDYAAALNQLIGEVILSLAGQVAMTKDVRQIVFVGSTLQGNQPLQRVIESFQNIKSFEAVFLEKGAYAGAIGALLE